MAADTTPPPDPNPYRLANVTRRLLDCFFQVYHELGSGFLEAVYANALAVALEHVGLPFQRECLIPIAFRGVIVGKYKADFVVSSEIVVELKAGKAIDRVHEAQLVNYLRGSTLELGFVFNFGPKPSYKRMILSNQRKSALCGHLRPSAVPSPGAPKRTRPS